MRKRLVFYVVCNSGGIKARYDSVYFPGCALWNLYLSVKLSMQLVLHNVSVCPEVN